MQTHPCFPLTDANKAEYERLNAAKAQLEITTDVNERITLMAIIGGASQKIRQIKQKESMNQIVPLNLPKQNDADEIARLRAINDKQQRRIEELETALVSIGYLTPTAECASRNRVATMAATLSEISAEMVI